MNTKLFDIKENNEFTEVQYTSEEGENYTIGYPKTSGYTFENLSAELKASTPDLAYNFCTINWVSDGDSVTSRAALNIGIVGGYVNHDHGIIYSYRLHFANDVALSGFAFKDATGDVYKCSTPRSGNHYIDYNSKKPNMIAVSKA